MTQAEAIAKAKEHFGNLLAEQLGRVERMKAGQEWLDYGQVEKTG